MLTKNLVEMKVTLRTKAVSSYLTRFFAPSGGASSSGGGLVDLREGGLLVPAGGRGQSVRALEGRARLLPTLRHPRDYAGTGTHRYRHSNFIIIVELCIGWVESEANPVQSGHQKASVLQPPV